MVSKKKLLVVLVVLFAIIVVECGLVFLLWSKCYSLEHPYRGESIAFQRCVIDLEIVEGWSPKYVEFERYLIIKDKSEWDDAFSNISYSSTQFNPDLINYTYVAVFWGRKPHSGYEIAVREITVNKGIVVVFVEKTRPSGVVLPVLTYPFEVVAFEKIYKPIEFEIKLNL